MEEFENAPILPALPRKQAGTRRELLFAAALLIMAILAADCLFWYGLNAGAGFCGVVLMLLSIAYLRKTRRTVSAYGLFCAAAFLAGAVSFTFSSDSYTKLLTSLAMGVLGIITVLEMSGLRRYEPGSYKAIGDVCHGMFVLTFGRMHKGIYALFHTEDGSGKVKHTKLGGVLLGIVCAIPLLAVLLPLLIRSDAAFEGLVNRLAFDKAGELFGAVLLGCTVFVLLFALLFSAARERREPQQEQTERDGLATAPLCAFLGAIAVFYLLYLLSQLAYFFSAFKGILPADYSVAEYARRGFFEMTAVCIINLAMITVTLIVCRKAGGKSPLSVRLLTVFISMFSLILVATSISKMALYIQSFGMTRLRILTGVFMAFLAIVFIAVSLRQFLHRLTYMKIAVTAGALLLLLVSYANVDKLVAAYNVQAYQSGRLKSVDVSTLSELSDAAVPYLLELSEDKDAEVARQARIELTSRLQSKYVITHEGENLKVQAREWDVRSFNTVEDHARRILEENWQAFYIEDTQR